MQQSCIDLASVLCSPVRVDNDSSKCRIRPDSIGKRTLAQYGFPVCVHCKTENCAIETVKYVRYIEFPIFCFNFSYVRDAFFQWFRRFEIPFQQVIGFSRLTVRFGNPIRFAFQRWLSPISSMMRLTVRSLECGCLLPVLKKVPDTYGFVLKHRCNHLQTLSPS